MQMNKTCPISNLSSEGGLISLCLRRVFETADRSGGDRTSDRAGEARESAARFQPVRQRPVSIAVSVNRQWHGRVPPFAQLREPRSPSERNLRARLSRSA